MQELKLKAIGTSALLMHNIKGANPLSIYAKTMKPLTAKRNKTDADIEEIARFEWECGLYLEGGIVTVPDKNIIKCVILGARRSKNGKKIESGVVLKEDNCPLSYKGAFIKVNQNGNFPNIELNKFYLEHNHQTMVVISGRRILRTRPIFHEWSFGMTMLYDENIIDERTLVSCIEDAGKFIGLMEMRPFLGRFDVDVVGN